MSVSRIPKQALDVVLLNLIGLVDGLWESAFIFKREWEEKKPYAKKVLSLVDERVKEINTNHREYVLVKEMERFYQPKISFKDLGRYVSMIKESRYKEALNEIGDVGKELKGIWDSFNRIGYLGLC